MSMTSGRFPARRGLRWSIAAGACALAFVPGAAAAGAVPSAGPSPAPGWRQAATASVPPYTRTALFAAVAANSGTWALSQSFDQAAGTVSLWRWNGTGLDRIALPAGDAGTVPGHDSWALTADKRDAWVFRNGQWLRFNGKTWTTGTLPGGGSVSAFTAAGAAGDAWAFGSDGTSAYAARFDGTRWTRTALPQPGPGYAVFGASAVSPDDVWAVENLNSRSPQNPRPRLLHWDGHRWHRADLFPQARVSDVWASTVSAVSPSNVWITGRTWGDADRPSTFAAHWNGHAWATGTMITSDTAPEAAAAASAPDGKGGLWLITSEADNEVSLWHYAGGRFTKVRTSPGLLLEALARVPRTTSVWAAGMSGINARRSEGTLLLHGKPPR